MLGVCGFRRRIAGARAAKKAAVVVGRCRVLDVEVVVAAAAAAVVEAEMRRRRAGLGGGGVAGGGESLNGGRRKLKRARGPEWVAAVKPNFGYVLHLQL